MDTGSGCAGFLCGFLPHSVPPEHPYLTLTGAGYRAKLQRVEGLV